MCLHHVAIAPVEVRLKLLPLTLTPPLLESKLNTVPLLQEVQRWSAVGLAHRDIFIFSFFDIAASMGTAACHECHRHLVIAHWRVEAEESLSSYLVPIVSGSISELVASKSSRLVRCRF